jgi:hypothetical protein
LASSVAHAFYPPTTLFEVAMDEDALTLVAVGLSFMFGVALLHWLS